MIFLAKTVFVRNYLLLFFCCLGLTIQAQNFESVIRNYFDSNIEDFNFQRSDLQSFFISNQSYSKSMDLYNVYVQQNFQNIPLKNALGSFAVRQNQVVNFNHSFISDIDQKLETNTATISAENAIKAALTALDLNSDVTLVLKESLSNSEFIFESAELSSEVIPVKQMYVLTDDRKLRLAWDLSILTKEENHWWSVSIDAQTGDILDQNDWILTCSFEHDHKIHNTNKNSSESLNYNTLSITNDGSQYRAYPLGVESPNHGSRLLLSQPADPLASPFGWHDTDGIPGAEFTITRGNNVIASEDRDGDNVPGYSPDGGTSLNFDFPLDLSQPPALNQDAAITNLFVWNNYNHDIWHAYGFDESSGNFQENNYTGLGFGNDFVVADAQDGSGFNNANFGTPPDGFNPRMQMFLWSPAGPPPDILTVNSPSDIAGEYSGLEASFGPGLIQAPITGDLALIEDDNFETTDPHDACDNITNGSDLNGKIVVINRGECTFVEKITKAENNGAIAVIMVNNVPANPITMGGAPNSINIPSIMISSSDGLPLVTKLQNNENINVTLVNNGPYEVDGDFDNVIIAHEYGHGVSTRLTGGPSQANCLFNDEQMGEGWSDWLGLMMTIKPGDFPEQARGVGTFAISQPVTGQGIRPAPYSTDFSINPATYGLSNNPNISSPHGVGFVWSTMLWDLTWELIDQYGFDPDFINGNGGNNLAMQLVLDGMKLQNCEPGFIDGRDAILQADMLANGGANQCYIWKVFANRGLGFSATQGSSDSRFDQVEAFDLPADISLPCEELSLEDFDKRSVRVYPNPTDDILNIEELSGRLGNANLKLYDLNGRLLMNKALNFNQLQQIDVSGYQPGVYVLKIENSAVNISKKLIIQ